MRYEQRVFKYSIVIPTYNRVDFLPRSLASARRFVERGDAEIVLVDDASTDETCKWVYENCSDLIIEGRMQYILRKQNGGPCVAKNEGVFWAKGEWIIFLDSDDELLPEAYDAITHEIEKFGDVPVIFFRCVGSNGRLIGQCRPSGKIEYERFLHEGTPGECLPVVKRSLFMEELYDDDLHGFEHLSYCRLAKKFGCLAISDKPVRIYHTDACNRLSNRFSRYSRACVMVKGFARWLSEFGSDMRLTKRIAIVARCVYYGFICIFLAAWRLARAL